MNSNNCIKSSPIDRLENFCKSNPELWIGKYKFLEKIEDVDKREELRQQLEQAIKDYSYVRSRKSRGKLSTEDTERLKEYGVGGVFGYTKEIENIANKYNYGDVEFFKKFLTCACAKYGNLDGFRNYYIESLTDHFSNRYEIGILLKLLKESVRKSNISNILDKYFITEFDISNPNFQSECPKGYYRLYREINRNQSIVFDSESLDNAINENKYLTDKEREVLNLRFEFGSNEIFSRKQIGKKYNVSIERIRQIEGKAIRKTRTFLRIRDKNINPENTYSEYSTLKKHIEIAFIKKYFEYHDIFADSKVVELPENAKTVLKEMIRNKTISNTDNENIETLQLSVRVYYSLKRARINNISELTNLTLEQFIRIKHLGPQTRNEIIEKIHSLGLKMQWEENNEDPKVAEDSDSDKKANIDIELENTIQSLKNAYSILNEREKTYKKLSSIAQSELPDNEDELE